MKIHYFQRYHQKENVATANTMLLLSRLYSYSPTKFYTFLQAFVESDFELEPIFRIQERSKASVPDATITQEGFKIVVETKMWDWFDKEQLKNHLESFGNESTKILITLSSELMDKKKYEEIQQDLEKYNKENKTNIIHINTTFILLAEAIEAVIEERDYEMHEILEDYREYCYNDGLIAYDDSWKILRMRPAGTTIKFNSANNVNYDRAERGFCPHDYVGLYTQKSLRYIGKVCARITAVDEGNGLEYEVEFGELTEDRKKTIDKAIEDGKSYGYNLKDYKHRYFFVEKFYETDFRKISKGGSMGARIFDLTEILKTNELPDVKTIAELLRDETWT